MSTKIDLLDELAWRGLLYQCTDEGALRGHLARGRRRVYAGFDPTADSLTIGNLVPIMLLKHVQRAGHDPVVIMGGGTGLIGDPSGKSAERQLMTRDIVEQNIAAQRPIFTAVLGEDISVVNNADWLTRISFLDALRGIGKHFSINMMMQKESVKSRLEDRDQGISYTEFSYMILQAFDFAFLHRAMGVTIQCGGSDQFGNMVAGTDLVRRVRFREFVFSQGGGLFDPAALDRPLPDDPDGTTAADKLAPQAFAFTAPLVSKADGGKFGKTESGAVWLTRERTSPYAYYQFWLNTTDADVGRFLRTFTLLPREEIERLERETRENPAKREAQRTLAREATALLHGADEAAQAESAGRALFSGDLRGLSAGLLDEVLAGAPATVAGIASLSDGLVVLDLLVETGLAKSKREARQFLESGSVSVNGDRVGPEYAIGTDDLLHGRVVAIRRGKKSWHVLRFD
ncbi:MAG: tyrosine--tRNA ligase [Planctomycetota bacterium]